jgi:enoyl-CoA hydratase/carnithine racemase
VIADRRLCLDLSRTRLVEANTAESAFLLAGKGQEIEADEVKRLGLVVHEGRVMQASQVPEPVYEMAMEPAAEMAPEPDAEPKAEAEAAPIMPSQPRRSRRRY